VSVDMKVKIPPKLSVAQKKAMMGEVNRQIAESVSGLSTNFVAVMLWELHEQKGWGKKQLLDFHKKFVPALKELQEYYLMNTAQETDFICKYKLKEIGIDVDKLDDILNIEIAYK
jgi:hypothetical protein